jgi:hypothetical protein
MALAERSADRQMQRWVQGALAERDLVCGHAAAARDRLVLLLDGSDYQERDVMSLLPLLAWAMRDLGEGQAAADILARLMTHATSERMQPALLVAMRVEALLAISHGMWKEAEQAVVGALALCQSLCDPYSEAKTLYVYGQLCFASGESVQARAQYEAALAILTRLGERLYAAQVERALTAME